MGDTIVAEEQERRERVKAYRRKYYLANAEKLRAADRKRTAKNPGRSTAAVKRWKKANPEKVKAARQAYEAAHRTELNAKARAWRKANPEKVKALHDKWAAKHPDKVKAADKRKYEKHKITILARAKRHRDANVDRLRNEFRKKKYHITTEEYDAMLASQGYRCALCNAPPGKKQLAVDHCHTAGHVRNLLCSKCNTVLGLFNEDPILFRKAADYLESHVVGTLGHDKAQSVPGTNGKPL